MIDPHSHEKLISPVPAEHISMWEHYLADAVRYIELNSQRFIAERDFLKLFIDAYAVIAFHISEAARLEGAVVVPDLSGAIQSFDRTRDISVVSRMTLSEAQRIIQQKFAEYKERQDSERAGAEGSTQDRELSIDDLPEHIQDEILAMAEEMGISLDFKEGMDDLIRNFYREEELEIEMLVHDKKIKKLLEEIRQTYEVGIQNGTYVQQPSGAGRGAGGKKER